MNTEKKSAVAAEPTTAPADARTRLMRAVSDDDWTTIGELGWAPIYDKLKKNPNLWNTAFTAADAVVYAELLGDRPPELVLGAVESLAKDGKRWRPSVPEIAERMGLLEPAAAPKPGESAAALIVRQRQTATRAAHAAGEQPCECRPRAVNWTRGRDGVLRHDHPLDRGCGGLEPGALDAAMAAAGSTAQGGG